MEIEYITEEQLAGRMRAMCQRVETENQKLHDLVLSLLIVNGMQELPSELPKEFTKGWEIKTKRVRRKVIYSAVMKTPILQIA